jgi:hypothetical protein
VISWPTGIETIKHLLATDDLQKVSPSPTAASAFLDAAAKHLDSALLVADADSEGAYTLLYDAARKSLAAVLQAQGLRATTAGRPSAHSTGLVLAGKKEGSVRIVLTAKSVRVIQIAEPLADVAIAACCKQQARHPVRR